MSIKVIKIYGEWGKTGSSTWSRSVDVIVNSQPFTIVASMSDTMASWFEGDPDSYYMEQINNNLLIEQYIVADDGFHKEQGFLFHHSKYNSYPGIPHIVFTTS